MKYQKVIEHTLTGLTDKEFSAIQAGLVALSNGERLYPEYKMVAADLLNKIDPVQAGTDPADLA